MARITSSTSAPIFSQMSAIRFAYEILTAKKELHACLINSALLMLVTNSAGASFAGQFRS
jgi:hypothetical protein